MQRNSLQLRGGMVLFAMTFILCSCQKEIKEPSNVSLSGNTTGKDGFPNYSFNWETATTMMPSTTEPQYNPTMPWSSQSGSYIDPAIINDYKSSDGWVLVYNTFNPTNNEYITNAADGGLYFALYNKFRGLLRFYLYVPSGQFGGGANIQHGLSVYSSGGTASTSMLNFDGADIVDPNVNVAQITKTNNVGVAQQGGWYAMQYQIAYDPNFTPSNASFPNIGMTWNSRTVSISQVTLNGTQAGTITGNITQQSNSPNIPSVIINGALAAIEIFGIVEGDDGFLGTFNDAASNGLAGNLTGFLSGIFGGNSNNPNEVDLTMNSTINLTGTINTPNALAPNTLVFPGESIATNNPSNPPLYTAPLGVFNLTSRPTVTQIVHTEPDDQGLYDVQYSVAGSQFNSILATNPAVWGATGGANYENFTTLVQVINPVLEDDLLVPGSSTNVMSAGNAPYVGNNRIVIQQNVDDDGDPIPLLTQYGRNPAQLAQTTGSLGTMAVQISFNVYPRNGGASFTIAKTFLANVQTIIE